MKQTHCTQIFWSNDRTKPHLGENPKEEFLIKEEYSIFFLQRKKLFLQHPLTKFHQTGTTNNYLEKCAN